MVVTKEGTCKATAVKKSRSMAAPRLLVSIFFTLLVIAGVPQLAQAATQHQRKVESGSQIHDLNAAGYGDLGDIFESEMERSSVIKGNRLRQEDVDEILRGNALAEVMASVFNSTGSQSP